MGLQFQFCRLSSCSSHFDNPFVGENELRTKKINNHLLQKEKEEEDPGN